MPTIPPPFVGGPDAPQRDSTARREAAPPFYPGQPPDVESLAAETAEEPEGPATGWGGPVEAGAPPEPEELPAEELEPAEEAEPAEPVLAQAKTVPLDRPPPPQPDLAEVSAEVPAADEPAVTPEPEPAVSVVSEEVAEAYEFPDYLFGADGTPDEATPTDVEHVTTVAPEREERLADLADELMAGEEGDQIRALIEELGPLASEVALPQAFAAGYLAAKKREER